MFPLVTTSTVSAIRTAVQIQAFEAEAHLRGAVEALLRVRRHEGVYPPRQDAKETVHDFAFWLLNEDALERWVAVIDGEVAGHISLTDPHAYLSNALDGMGFEAQARNGICEVSKFFVDPLARGAGVGSFLLDAALRSARARGLQPALAVVDTSLAARRLYASTGMTQAGSFRGIHGKNFVFIDEKEPAADAAVPAVAVLAA